MARNDRHRYQLLILYLGEWRKVMESDERKMLVEYANTCKMETRIIDTTEEVNEYGNKRH